MSSIFTKIIKGEIPSYKIAENDYCYAFLDAFPLKKGHTLVVPKLEVDKLFDLPEKEYQELMNFGRLVARAIEKTIPCKRISLTVIGLIVPHAHLHLIPLDKETDINFSNPKLQLSTHQMNEIAKAIQEKL